MTVDNTTVQPNRPEQLATLSRHGEADRTIAGSDEDIRGRMVKDKDGLDVGRVEGLRVDDSDRTVRFMEVGSGGFLRLGESKSFIPVDAITGNDRRRGLYQPTREHVAGAPRYDPDLVKDDPHFYFNPYPYYGYMGYMGAAPSDSRLSLMRPIREASSRWMSAPRPPDRLTSKLKAAAWAETNL